MKLSGDRGAEPSSGSMADDAGQRLHPGSCLVRVSVDDDTESQIVRVGP